MAAEGEESRTLRLLDLLTTVIENGEKKIRTEPQAKAFTGTIDKTEQLSKEEADVVANQLVASIRGHN